MPLCGFSISSNHSSRNTKNNGTLAQYNIEERRQLLDIASAEKNLPKQAIEKDWWVTMVLKALSQTQYSNLFSFKGGTSLSKNRTLQ